MPNPVYWRELDPSGRLIWVDAAAPDPMNPGGADEDYDIPDFQNMILAMQVSQGLDANGNQQDPAVPIPSLHRPALINYWQNQPGFTQDMMRNIMLRPNQFDHPQFTGSTLGFHPVNGPWDIDNNGDGLPDSVWVDLGFPVQTADDGRQFKPLAAILVLDLDGRLNLNAHGKAEDTNGYAPTFDFSGTFASGVAPGRKAAQRPGIWAWRSAFGSTVDTGRGRRVVVRKGITGNRRPIRRNAFAYSTTGRAFRNLRCI